MGCPESIGATIGHEASGQAKLRRGSSLSSSTMTLGEKVMAFNLVAPTLLNWLALAIARWYGTVEVMDSEGVAHTTQSSRCLNFEFAFFIASTTCASTVFAHVWLTTGAIARRHALAHAGAFQEKGYAPFLLAWLQQRRRPGS
jgi:hypothetical protein